MSAEIYYPTYHTPIEMAGDDARWLHEQDGEGPLRLEDVTDVCATYRVQAELRDARGFLRGHVRSDGSYTLS